MLVNGSGLIPRFRKSTAIRCKVIERGLKNQVECLLVTSLTSHVDVNQAGEFLIDAQGIVSSWHGLESEHVRASVKSSIAKNCFYSTKRFFNERSPSFLINQVVR